jgi:hypothetical protein
MQDGYAEALSAETKEDFMAVIKKTDPKSFIVFHDKLEYYVEKWYKPPVPQYEPEDRDFLRVPIEMRDWVVEEMVKKDRPKTLVVWGPSRTGKTSWARSHGSHSYMAYAWNIKCLDQGSNYLVVDDVSLTDKSFHLWQPILGK